MNALLQSTAHRPWLLPRGPWLMKQIWHDLLFAHWPVPSSVLRALVPQQLPLDTFDSQCWIGVVPFRMSGIRAHGTPPLPGLSRFPELNVRTYVTYGGKPGVFFFSLDAASSLAVWAARKFYHLPYFRASMWCNQSQGGIQYLSRRLGSAAEFRGSYGPTHEVRLRAPGSFEHWAAERYCLYTVHDGEVYRCEIHHQQWPLQNADADLEINTVAQASGIHLYDTRPLLHFARELEVLIWPLCRA